MKKAGTSVTAGTNRAAIVFICSRFLKPVPAMMKMLPLLFPHISRAKCYLEVVVSAVPAFYNVERQRNGKDMINERD